VRLKQDCAPDCVEGRGRDGVRTRGLFRFVSHLAPSAVVHIHDLGNLGLSREIGGPAFVEPCFDLRQIPDHAAWREIEAAWKLPRFSILKIVLSASGTQSRSSCFLIIRGRPDKTVIGPV
jgi:hypothetical protein